MRAERGRTGPPTGAALWRRFRSLDRLTVALFVVWAGVALMVGWVIADVRHPKDPVADSIAEYLENGITGEERISMLVVDDSTPSGWRVLWAEGGPDTVGHSASEVIGMDAAEVYPGPEANALRSIGGEVLESGVAAIVDARLNGVDIRTRVFRVSPTVVVFATSIDGGDG